MYVTDLWRRFLVELLEADRGGGSGSSGSSGNDNDNSDADDDDVSNEQDDTADEQDDDSDLGDSGKQQSPAKAFTQLLDRYNGDTQALAEKLFRDNFKLRAGRRLMNEQITEMQRQLPRKGAVTLGRQDNQLFQDYKRLGTPKQLKDAQDELVRLRSQVADNQQATTLSRVAQVTGYNADALKELGGKLTYEVREVTGTDGAKAEEAFVVEVDTVNGQKVRKETPVKTYASEKWKIFLPALTAGDGSNGSGGSGSQGVDSSGRKFVRQASAGNSRPIVTGNAKPEGVASGYLQRAYGTKKNEGS